jgi:arylsulfatase A
MSNTGSGSVDRREFIKGLGVAASALAVGGCAPGGPPAAFSAARRPNIVLILADDVGREALGCYGGGPYRTPNLDRLAGGGVRFTHAYSCPMCAPSRVKIMTGRYGFRNYKKWAHIPPGEVTFGHTLQAAGYAAAIAGKWQMAFLRDDPDHVCRMGFAESCVNGWHEGPRYYGPLIYQNGNILETSADDYGPDIYCKFLTDFMERNRHRPFLAYYSMAAAHDISDDFKPVPPVGPLGRYKTYGELVEYMDVLVGRVVETLDRLGLRDNTVILFTGDNGCPAKFITGFENGQYIRQPVPLEFNGEKVAGGKGSFTDAGTRVPLIANWPGVAPAGAVCDDLIDFSDFMPTLAELAGTSPPADRVIDGVSFAPQIMAKRGRPRDWAYCQYESRAWIRTKRWKLYQDGSLFDAEADPAEQNPIAPGEGGRDAAAAKKYLKRRFDRLRG